MGNFVLPGVVDEHVHMQDMGRAEVADFVCGSAAAAIVGVTTVMEMPLTLPATTTLEAFEEKREVATKKFIVDFALYGGAVPGNIDEISKMVEAGAVGFKAMMAGSVPGLFEILDDGLLFEAFKTIADCNSVITLHAENEAIINYLENKLKTAGRKDIRAFFESRPIMQEVEAISRSALLAKEAGCHLHVVHVSCPQGIDLIYKRKMEGQLLTSETGPHYLALSEDDGVRLGPYIKFAPPARSKTETEELWQQLADGKIDALGSDDGAHEKENKEKGWENIWEAGSGAIGVETMLPVMLSEGVNKNRISIQKLVSLLSENPAKIFGIYPQKGVIQVGSDADVVIVDMEKEYVIEAEKLHSKEKHTPYDGLKVKGIPVLTLVRGEVVMDNGEVKGKPGDGKFVTPSR
jgi:allantoinase